MVPLVDVFKFNLILKQCERDNKAFETLFDFYYPRIKLHIHKKFPDACADDVAQEFFLQLMKSHGFKYVQNPTAWGVWKNRMLEFEFECITIYEDHCNPAYLINQVMREKTSEEKARQLAPLESVEKWIPFRSDKSEDKTTQTIKKQSRLYDGGVLFLTNLYKKVQKTQYFFKNM